MYSVLSRGVSEVVILSLFDLLFVENTYTVAQSAKDNAEVNETTLKHDRLRGMDVPGTSGIQSSRLLQKNSPLGGRSVG
jgi:hypothetical protein